MSIKKIERFTKRVFAKRTTLQKRTGFSSFSDCTATKPRRKWFTLPIIRKRKTKKRRKDDYNNIFLDSYVC